MEKVTTSVAASRARQVTVSDPDPQDLLTGEEYEDPTDEEVTPDDPSYVEPWKVPGR